jgi:hypothetical protein
LLLCGFLAGCSLGNKRNKAEDPLLGNPKGPPGPGAPAAPPPGTRSQAEVPPIPTASSSPSNAALAANPLPGSRPLSIGSVDAAATPAGTLTSGPSNGAKLSRPEPIVQPIPRDAGSTAPGTSAVVPVGTWGAAGQQPTTTDPIQQKLKDRGVTFQRQEVVSGGIHFSCTVPNPQNPAVTRFFEATAPDYPSAVQAVLQQMDQK